MTTDYYCFADFIFRIDSPLPMKKDERFEAFRVSPTEQVDFHYCISPLPKDKTAPVGHPILIEQKKGKIYAYMDTSLLPGITLNIFLSNADAQNLILEKGCFILHCSHILKDGKSLLCSAPSGTGKSTLATFYQHLKHTRTVNEDRALIRLKNGIPYAYGCWATGHAKTCCNESAPIDAILLLGQGEKNHVFKIHTAEKLQYLLPQCSYDTCDSKQIESIMQLLLSLIELVPVFRYDFINDESAVTELENFLCMENSL